MSRSLCLAATVVALIWATPAASAAKGEAPVSAAAAAKGTDKATTPAPPEEKVPRPPLVLARTPVPPDLVSALDSDDLDRATDAVDKVAALKSDGALDALLDTLAMGPSPRVAYDVLEALAPYASPREIGVVAAYLHNRNSDLRAGAVAALGVVDDPRIGSLLLGALDDQAGTVRAAAAMLVAQRRDAGAEGRLLKLFKRGDVAAAVPLGMVATSASAAALGELFGQVPNDMLATCLGTMLARPDLGSDDLRVSVVKLLGKIPGPSATAALAQYVASVPEKPGRASRTEAQKALEARQ